eukprot:761300-Hanusia_phi.AAC.2
MRGGETPDGQQELAPGQLHLGESAQPTLSSRHPPFLLLTSPPSFLFPPLHSDVHLSPPSSLPPPLPSPLPPPPHLRVVALFAVQPDHRGRVRATRSKHVHLSLPRLLASTFARTGMPRQGLEISHNLVNLAAPPPRLDLFCSVGWDPRRTKLLPALAVNYVLVQLENLSTQQQALLTSTNV